MITKELLNINQTHLRLIHLLSNNIPSSYGLDEFGFVKLEGINKEAYVYHILKGKRTMNPLRVGRGNYLCKDLCRFIPKQDSRSISFSKNGHYFCGTCDIAMKCARCKCCGRLGRREPRGRHQRLNKQGVKFIE